MVKTDPGPEFWELVRVHTGEVYGVRHTEHGSRADVTALVRGESESVFVKAVRTARGQGHVDSIEREAAINAYVPAPKLLWVLREGGWIVLGFEAVDGRESSFDPDSTDLPAIVSVIDRVASAEVPTLAQEWAETRWDRFCDGTDHTLLRGTALVHGDINPNNFLMAADGTATLVDWAWPTVGAAFLTSAGLVSQLIASGHSAEGAEAWAAGCSSWTGADPKAIDVYATATVRMWRSLANNNPDAGWIRAMVTASEAWTTHRGVYA
ncbi:hypothetical protein GCM10009839_08190 [Catenulispora yoronensis]|uniref:Aminoglycoside phosphotransferase n=1 Tax=Catenulispora yoronensis TaxID=450799 RepID=A0ABP5F2V2_9ACTN